MSDNLRDYSENDNVAEFYKSLYENQSLENNKRLKLKYNSGCNVKMYMMDALHKLDDFIDPSDPDVSVPNSIHAYQTAERIRKKYPDDIGLQVTGLIHDLGKVLFTFNEPNYFIVGDTYVLGAKIPREVEHYSLVPNPDRYSELGIYSPNCGLEELEISYGHDEYLYQVLNNNKKKHKLDTKYMNIIRYHSFYPWHTKGAYSHLISSKYDLKILRDVQSFNEFDLYSKTDSIEVTDATREYYKKIIYNIFPFLLDF